MANEIGKVAVRVYPDTTGFATETKRKLQRLRDQKYPVQVELDEDKLNRQIDLMVAKINAKLAQKQNHIRFKADLDLTNAEARAQVNAARKKYQTMADAARDVSFDSKLKSDIQDSEIRVTPKIDQEQFSRDLQRAVKQATRNNDDISIWGDDGRLRSQADRAALVFSERLAQANEKTSMFGDRAKMEADAHKSATSIRESFRAAFKDFNLFGKKGDIEDDAVTALDIFKRKWKAAQGKLNIRADLDFDQAQFDRAREELDTIQRRYNRSADLLASQGREYQRIVAEARRVRMEMDKIQKAMAGIDKSNPGGMAQWHKATAELEKQAALHKNMIAWSRELGERNKDLVQSISIDSGSLVDAEAHVAAWRRQVEIRAIEIDVDISTAAAEAWMAFITRPRVVEIRTRIANKSQAAIRELGNISKFNWSTIGKGIAGFGARSSGIRMLYQTARDMFDIVPKLDMMIPQLAQTSVLAATAISGVGTLLASAVSIGADMMKAGQALLIAPAGLAGLSLFAAVLIGAWGDIEAAIPGIDQAHANLMASLSDGFWYGKHGSTIIDFITDFLDVMTKFGPGIGESVASSLAGLANGFRDVADVQGPRFLKNFHAGLKAAQKGFRSLGSALFVLTGAGSDTFESLGGWFTKVTGDFDSWVKKNDANGNLVRWINEGGQAIRDIGSVIMSAGSMFATFGEIVKEAGGPSLSTFAAGLREVREAMKGGLFHDLTLAPLKAMFDFMKGLGRLKPDAMTAISTAVGLLVYSLNGLSKPAVDIFGAIFRGFSSRTFIKGWQGFIDGMGSFLSDIAPGMELFVAELGGLFGIVGTAAESFGGAFNELLFLVGELGANIHPGLESFLKFVGPELERLIKAVSPGLQDMAEGFGDILSNKGIQAFLSDVNDHLQDIAGVVFDAANGILDIGKALGDAYSGSPKWLRDAASWLGALGGAALVTAPLLKPLIWPLTALLGLFKTPLKNLARNSIFAALDGLSRLKFGTVASGLTRIVAPLAAVTAIFTAPIGGGQSINEWLFRKLGLDGLANFSGEVKKKINSVTGGRSIAGILWDAIKESFGKFKSGDIKGGFMALVDGLWTVIDGIFTSKMAFGQQLFEKILGWLGLDGAPGYEIWKDYGFDGTFGSIFTALHGAITDGLGNWMRKFDQLMRNWKPTGGIGKGMKFVYDRLPGLLGFDKKGSWSFKNIGKNWGDLAGDIYREVKSWLDKQISKLWDKIKGWKIVRVTLGFAKKIGDAIAQIFGYEDWSSLTKDLGEKFESLKEDVLACLDRSWAALKQAVLNWKPVRWVINFATIVGDLLHDALNLKDGWIWDCTNLDEIWSAAYNGVKDWITREWKKLGAAIATFDPVAWAQTFGDWLGKKILKWVSGNPVIQGGLAWWATAKAWFVEKWTQLLTDIGNWQPAAFALTFATWLVAKLVKWMTGSETIDDGGRVNWWPIVIVWLKTKWDQLIQNIRDYNPITLGFKFSVWLGTKLAELFGKKEPVEDGGRVDWWPVVKAWVKAKWDQLIQNIQNWNPVSVAFRFGAWLGRKLAELFSPDGEPDPKFDFSGWLEKVKNGITTGLKWLVIGIVAFSPVGIVIALGLLIVKWIFGAGASAQDLAQTVAAVAAKVVAFAGAVGEGISQGIAAIGRLIGTIVHEAICLPQYILDEVFTECFDEGGMVSRVKEKVNGWGKGIASGVSSGISGLRERLKGLGNEGGAMPGSSLINGILGTTPAGAQENRVNLGAIMGGITGFASGVVGQFSTMGSGSKREISGLADNTGTEFGKMENTGKSKTESMSTGVVGKMAVMAATATAKAAGMAASVSSKMTSMQTAASAKAAAMQAKVVGSMGQLQSGVISKMTGMASRAGAQMASMSSKVVAQMGSMASRAGAQMANMGSKVVAQMTSMQSRGVAQIVRFQSAAVRAISSASSAIVAQGRNMGSGFASAMSSMASRAMSIVGSLRGRLAAGLRINAHGAGSFTGSTFVSGLAGGLSRAAGIAHSMAGRIRGALSFSTYSSGSTVGGTFASGIASRVGAVAAAANRLAAAARARMPRSPAKEGPFSGAGWGGWGESIGDELARGLKKSAPAVAKEADALMSGVTDALDARAEVGVGASTKAAKAAAAARAASAQAQGEESPDSLTAADLRDAVSKGMADLIGPATDRDMVAFVRRANRNGAR